MAISDAVYLNRGWLAQGLECDALRTIVKAQS